MPNSNLECGARTGISPVTQTTSDVKPNGTRILQVEMRMLIDSHTDYIGADSTQDPTWGPTSVTAIGPGRGPSNSGISLEIFFFHSKFQSILAIYQFGPGQWYRYGETDRGPQKVGDSVTKKHI